MLMRFLEIIISRPRGFEFQLAKPSLFSCLSLLISLLFLSSSFFISFFSLFFRMDLLQRTAGWVGGRLLESTPGLVPAWAEPRQRTAERKSTLGVGPPPAAHEVVILFLFALFFF